MDEQTEKSAIQKLYPDFTLQEQEEAEYALKRYVNLVWRIYSRLRRENPEYLTKERLNARFKRPRK